MFGRQYDGTARNLVRWALNLHFLARVNDLVLAISRVRKYIYVTELSSFSTRLRLSSAVNLRSRAGRNAYTP